MILWLISGCANVTTGENETLLKPDAVREFAMIAGGDHYLVENLFLSSTNLDFTNGFDVSI